MALADTARLIASLELQDKFSGTTKKFEGTLGVLEKKTSTLGRIGSQVGSGLQATSRNLTLIGVAGVGLLAANITAGIASLQKLELAQAQTEAVLKSTQSVAGQTADSIRNLAEKYESLNATMDDKVIQSAENVLLTFTNIRKEAFEPALEAALNMNQALGGGEEGLQGTVIQLGKALQDPIKGITALRRVGVNFTEQQKKQIKDLIEQNNLYGAQQIILKELATEFGGSFAAAGDTATGKFAKFRDAIEDAQAALATAFLPLLGKVADKISVLLSDPAVLQQIEQFGSDLAGGLEQVLEVGGSLPWAQIGDAFKVVGTGSKALLDAFLGLPPWVQTAVLTGWGLNKLTGGALGGIAGTLAKAAFGGLRGSTPANPVFVSQVGGIPGGGGAPVSGGFGSLLLRALGIGGAVAGGALLGNAIARPTFDRTVEPAVRFEETQFEKLLRTGDDQDLRRGLDAINEGLAQLGNDNLLGRLVAGDQIGILEDQRKLLIQRINQGATVESEFRRSRATSEQLLSLQNSEKARRTAEQAQALASWRSQERSLAVIAGKDPIVNVNVAATANISVSNVARTLTSFRIAGSTTVGGFTETAF